MVCPPPFNAEGQSSAMPGSPMKSRAQSPAPSVPTLLNPRFWILAIGVLTVLAAGSPRVFAQSPNSYYKQGQAAESRDDFDTAYQDFQKAYSMSPKNEVFERPTTACGSPTPRCT